MPDSVEIPAPLSTSTPPGPNASATGVRSVVPAGRSSGGDQLRVGRMRMPPGYGTGCCPSFRTPRCGPTRWVRVGPHVRRVSGSALAAPYDLDDAGARSGVPLVGAGSRVVVQADGFRSAVDGVRHLDGGGAGEAGAAVEGRAEGDVPGPVSRGLRDELAGLVLSAVGAEVFLRAAGRIG